MYSFTGKLDQCMGMITEMVLSLHASFPESHSQSNVLASLLTVTQHVEAHVWHGLSFSFIERFKMNTLFEYLNCKTFIISTKERTKNTI